MQEELRRSNTIGDSQGIIYFASTVLKSESIQKESARQICSFVNDLRVNFNCAVAFFEYLGLIKVYPYTLIPTEDGKRLYLLLRDGFEEALCEACLCKITIDEIIDISALHFNTANGKYYIQRHGFPISAAVFRNVLIQLNALSEMQDGSGYFELNVRYEAIFAKAQKKIKRMMSIDALKKKLEKQELQGEAAEECVVKYEKARILNLALVEKIKRISDIDVSAGYDVVSFEEGKSVQYDRFIEVKSYEGHPHFYWSKNEIDVATIYGDKYYIYLLDSDKILVPDYTPTIIRNPVKSVMDSDGWLMQPTSYLVLPTGVD